MSQFWIQDPQRGIIGPIGEQTVCDLFGTGTVSEEALVSTDGAQFDPLSAFSQLEVSPPSPTTRGELGEHTVLPVLYRLYVEKKTGMLVVRDGNLRKDIYLREGRLVFLSSNLTSERLGQFLVLHDKITEEELHTALDARDGNRLGETMVRLGLLEPAELYSLLRLHQLGRLIELCCWRSGSWSYYDGRTFHGDEPDLELSIGELIVQAAREMPAQMLLPTLSAHLHQAPRVIEKPALPWDEREDDVLGRLDGKHPVSALVDMLKDTRQQVLIVLHLLVELDGVAFENV